MVWTTLTKRAIGYLITKASDVDLWIDDIHYLKGQAGVVEMEAGIKSDTDVTDDLGATDKLWANIYARNVFGGRMRLNPNIREVRILWPSSGAPGATQGVSDQSSGSGSVLGDGTGQILAEVNDNVVGVARLDQIAPGGGAKGNSWVPSNKPYFRMEFNLAVARATSTIFMGIRSALGPAVPVLGAEHCGGLRWNGTVWNGISSNVVSGTATGTLTIADDARHVLEVYVNDQTNMEFWIDGVKVSTLTESLPGTSTALYFTFLLTTTGAGGATQSLLTLGQPIFQEALA